MGFQVWTLVMPFIICVVGLSVMLLGGKRWKINWWMVAMLVLLGVYMYINIWFYMPHSQGKWGIASDLLGKVSLMAVLPTILFWYKDEFDPPVKAWHAVVTYLIPLMYVVAMLCMYRMIPALSDFTGTPKDCFFWGEPESILGFGPRAMTFYLCGTVFYNILVFAFVVICLTYFIMQIVYLTGSRAKGKKRAYPLYLCILYTVVIAIAVSRMVVGHEYLEEHSFVCSLFYLFHSAILIVFIYQEAVRRYRFRHALTEQSVVSHTPDATECRDAFLRLMVDECGCYRAGLSAEEVARRLNIPPSRLTHVLRMFFNKSYTTWVLEQRLNHAKQLMLENPKIKQEEVAARCGFSSVSIFNRSFTRAEGIAPLRWVKKELGRPRSVRRKTAPTE